MSHRAWPVAENGCEKMEVFGTCFAHVHRATTLLCAVFWGRQWLEDESRWSVNRMAKRCENLTSGLARMGPVSLANFGPLLPKTMFIDDKWSVIISGIFGAEIFILYSFSTSYPLIKFYFRVDDAVKQKSKPEPAGVSLMVLSTGKHNDWLICQLGDTTVPVK